MLNSRPCKTTTVVLLSLLTLVLGACGTGTTGGGQPSGTGNNGGGRDLVDPAEKIAIQIEATDEMLVSWQSELYNLLTPSSAFALSGLEIRNNLRTSAITVVELGPGPDLEQLSSRIDIEYEVVEPFNKDGFEIWFKDPIIEKPNLAIKVELTADQILYAPLYSIATNANPVIINAGSTFVLKKLFERVTTVAAWEQLTQCNDPDNCLNQTETKATLVRRAAEAIQDYDLEFRSDQDLDSALTALENEAALNAHIETLVTSITETASPIASGTRRAVQIDAGAIRNRLNYNVDHNAVWLGFQMNDYRPSPVNNSDEVMLATASSKIALESETGKNHPEYPTFNINSSLLDLRRESLTAEIPIERSSLLLRPTSNPNFTAQDELTSYGLVSSDTFLSTKGFELNFRDRWQDIADSRDEAWEINPRFAYLYRANDFIPDTNPDNTSQEQNREYDASPTWLMTASVHTGGRFDSESTTGIFERGTKQEALNQFSWEVHGQQTTESFSRSEINGREYGVVGYGMKLSNSGKLLELFAETYEWEAISNDFVESSPTTYTLSRQGTNGVNPVSASSTISIGTRDFYLVETESDLTPSGQIQGWLGLDAGNLTRGHSSEDGRHLAFTSRDSRRGHSIILATEKRPLGAQPIFSGEVYRLQGNTIGINSDYNFAANLNESFLTINDRNSGDPSAVDCRAVLDLGALILRHDVTENRLEALSSWEPQNGASPGPFNSNRCTLEGGKISMEFEVYDNTLLLEGFVSTQGDGASNDATPGRVINMIWVHNDNLGLVFANLHQDLSPTFEN